MNFMREKTKTDRKKNSFLMLGIILVVLTAACMAMVGAGAAENYTYVGFSGGTFDNASALVTALNNAQSGTAELVGTDTVKLLKNVQINTEDKGGIIINGTIALDLNNCILKGYNDGYYPTITVNKSGNFTLMDSSEIKKRYYFKLSSSKRWVLQENEGTTTEYFVDGGIITGGISYTHIGAGVYVEEGTFNMTGGNIVGNMAYNWYYLVGYDYPYPGKGGGVYMYGGTFNMSGGSIVGNVADCGAGVHIQYGTFNMTGGNITQNRGTYTQIDEYDEGLGGYGGGVYVDEGTFNMLNGTISNNYVEEYEYNVGGWWSYPMGGGGGGVSVNNNGIFNMSGGNITQNTAEYHGGGVYVGSTGVFNLSNGNITQNRAYKYTQESFAENSGGGIFIDSDDYDGSKYGIFIMNGGLIKGNYAQMNGGGVDVYGGAMTMTGGEIVENTIGEVFEYYGGGGVSLVFGNLVISGTPVITGNGGYVRGVTNLAFLWGGTLEIDSEKLRIGANIGVTLLDGNKNPTYGNVTINYPDGAPEGGWEQFFTSDNPNYLVAQSGNHVVLTTLGEEGISVKYDGDNPSSGTVPTDTKKKLGQNIVVQGKGDLKKKDVSGNDMIFAGWQIDGAGKVYVEGDEIQVTKEGEYTLKALWVGSDIVAINVEDPTKGNPGYTNLMDAMNDVDDNHPAVRLIANVKINDGEDPTIRRNTTLDLNGFVVNLNGNHYFTDGGSQTDFTLTDSDLNAKSHKKHYFSKNDDGLWVYEGDIMKAGLTEVDGGVITGGTKGVFFSSLVNLNINGGTIAGNSCLSESGIVQVEKCEVTMTGGRIAGNVSDYCGGIYILLTGKFTMTGGSIDHNVTKNPSGAGGVMNKNSTVTVGGTALITDNHNSEGNNCNLVNIDPQSVEITRDGFKYGALIGIYMDKPEIEDYLTVANNYPGYNPDNKWEKYFRSDYYVAVTADDAEIPSKVVIMKDAPYVYTVSYDANGATSGTAPMDYVQYINKTGVKVKDAADLQKEGAVFEGWNTREDGSGNWYKAGSTLDDSEFGTGYSVKLYAEWVDTALEVSTEEELIKVLKYHDPRVKITVTADIRRGEGEEHILGEDEEIPAETEIICTSEDTIVITVPAGEELDSSSGEFITYITSEYSNVTITSEKDGETSAGTLVFAGDVSGTLTLKLGSSVSDGETVNLTSGTLVIGTNGGLSVDLESGSGITGATDDTLKTDGKDVVALQKVVRGDTVDVSKLGLDGLGFDDDGLFASEWRLNNSGSPVQIFDENGKVVGSPGTYYYTGVSSSDGTGVKNVVYKITIIVSEEERVVTYNANGGTGTYTEHILDGNSTTVPYYSPVTREGYTLKNWVDDDGYAYNPGESFKPESDMTLYAQWVGDAYTITYKSSVGNAPEPQEMQYGESGKLTRINDEEGKTFVGWATKDGGSTVYTNEQIVQDVGTITLYAVWSDTTYSVSGTVNNPTEGDKIELRQGNSVIQSKTLPSSGKYEFTSVPAGNYDLVVVNNDEDFYTGKVIITSVSVELDPITIDSAARSKIIINPENNTPSAVVGNLDQEAIKQKSKEEGSVTTVTLTVASKKVAEVPEDDSSEQAKEERRAQESIKKIAEKSNASHSDYLDMSIIKTVKSDGGSTTKESIKNTESLIEVIVPFDFSEKKNFAVWHHHGTDEAEPMADLDNITGNDDSEGYRKDTTNNLVHIYTKKFSVYAFCYDVVKSEATKGSSVTSFNSQKNGDTFTFSRSPVVIKATLPGVSTAKITKTTGDGWYNFKLDASGMNGSGSLEFQVPLADISVNKVTVNDVGIYHQENSEWALKPTYYQNSDNQYAYYTADITGDGTYSIGFIEGATGKETETEESTSTDTQGYLKITSTPAGATIQIEGVNYKGVTPQSKIALNPGTYTVTLSLDGYKDASQSFTIKAGETTPVTLSMEKKESSTAKTEETKTTTKSPMPVLGVLAGLGAAAVLRRR